MIKIWDNHNKQWLEPMSIIFDHKNNIGRVSAVKPGDQPLRDGWYDLEGDDLKKIAITGTISHNEDLIPTEDVEKDIEYIVGTLKSGTVISQKGYVRSSEEDHLVYENKSQYIVYLKNEKEGKPDARMTFYKDTLKDKIDFIEFQTK